MSAITDSAAVIKKIRGISERQKAAIFANAKNSVSRALAEFHEKQPYEQGADGYWTNQTSEAVKAVFGEAFIDDDSIGFFVAHGKEYGIHLELANNRKHEAIRPLVEKFGIEFLKKTKEVLKK